MSLINDRFISECNNDDDDGVEPSSSECNNDDDNCVEPSSSSSSGKRKRSEEAEGNANTNTKWIIKSPFSGNMLHFKYPVQDSARAIQYFTKTVLPKMNAGVSYYLPYLLFQKKLDDAREAKLCFFNKEFRHFCTGILTFCLCSARYLLANHV